ncbi:MAG: Lrp/AsnC family transcriptional regulator [Tepidisphaeraceae bacterium]|jgi:DNA-binding Lrp family transcriptional regulator
MSTATLPNSLNDPINARILAVSEDQICGFSRDPIGQIAEQSGLEPAVVIERITALLRAGVIRRVRQTLLATNLAQGSLVAWVVPPDQLNSAFDWMFQNDPFSGHVVIRSTDSTVAASKYRLWTTLKIPQGFSMQKHCRHLCSRTGAEQFKLMPAKRLFVLGVGHVRRRGLEPGSKADQPADVLDNGIVELSDLDWRVLAALKREFTPEEISQDLWANRARQAGVSLDEFCRVAEDLNRRGVIGRFSTFLEHVKPLADGQRVTRFNALFHWAVPAGREIDAGRQVGRFHVMTHAYWREGGPEFNHVNIMGVAHGSDKDLLLAHKHAIDQHLAAEGLAVSYTNVFWGGRSEIKPSEISPFEYQRWCHEQALDPDAMRV